MTQPVNCCSGFRVETTARTTKHKKNVPKVSAKKACPRVKFFWGLIEGAGHFPEAKYTRMVTPYLLLHRSTVQ